MRKLVGYGLAAVLAAGVSAPASAAWGTTADWEFCTGNALTVCMDFSLSQTSDTGFSLVTTWDSPFDAAGGVLTAVGLYRTDLPDIDVSNVAIAAPWNGTWSVGANDIQGGVILEVAANGQGNNGPAQGGSVTITFTSTDLGGYTPAVVEEMLGARAHIQSFGPNNCSLKPDSRAEGGLVDPVADINGRCGGSTVPEPVSLVLLGSGLFGLGALRLRRRNQ